MTVLTGRRLGGRAWLVSASVAIGVGTTPLAAPAVDANRVFQRDSVTGNPAGFGTGYNKGAGTVPVTLTAGGALASVVLKLRLRDAASLATVQDWITLPGGPGSLAAGANALVLTLPAGPVFYLVDLALATDMSGFVTVAGALGVGSVTAAAGQSICTGFFAPYAYGAGAAPSIPAMVSIAPGGVVYAPQVVGETVVAPGAASWRKPGAYVAVSSPYESSFAAEYLRLVTARLGVVAALTGHAVNGSWIDSWMPYGTTGYFAVLSTVLAHAGWKFESFIWCQGSTDAGYAMRRESYAAKLNTILAAIRAQRAANGVAAAMRVTLSPIPGHLGHDDRDRSSTAIQLACLDVAANPVNNASYNPFFDNGYYASGHPTMLSRVNLARQHYRVLMNHLGLASGMGPKLTGVASRAAGSKVIKLAVAQDGGASLHAWMQTEANANATAATTSLDSAAATANLAILFRVFPAGSTDSLRKLALDATTPVTLASATEIWLTLAAAQADNAALDVWYQTDVDAQLTGSAGAAALRDDVQDGDGIAYGRELNPGRVAVFVPAPVPDAAAAPSILTMPGMALGGVAAVRMDAAGSGYSAQPTVAIAGGARAVALSGSTITRVRVEGGGTGYGTAPSVSFSGGGGTGAAATAVLAPAVAASGSVLRVRGAAGGPPPGGIELSVDGGAFAAPGSLVVRNDGGWSGTLVAPGAGVHSLVARRPGGSAGAASSFTVAAPVNELPAGLRDAIASFDASLPGTMWQDVGRTVAAADLAPVRCMADAFGTASNEVTNTGVDAAVPLLELGSQQGLPGLVFEYRSVSQTVGRGLKTAAAAPALAAALAAGDFSVLTVYRSGIGARGEGGVWSVGRGAFSSTSYSSIMVGDGFGAASGAGTGVGTLGAAPKFVAWGAGTLANYTNGPGQSYETVLRTVARYQAATGTMRFHISAMNYSSGAVVAETSLVLSGATLGAGWDTLALGYGLHGNGAGGPAYAQSKLHQVTFWNRLLTDAERDSLQDYAVAKWGT